MISEVELQKISVKYDGLLAVAQGILKADDRQLLDNAFAYCREVYGDSRHLTGDLLICHSLAVARIAAEEMGLGINPVIAALLHDAVVIKSVNIEDIRKRFGPVIADLVKGYARITTFRPAKSLCSRILSENCSWQWPMISG